MKVTSKIGFLAVSGFLLSSVSFAQSTGKVAIQDLTLTQELGTVANNGPQSEFHHGHHGHHHHHGDHHHHHHFHHHGHHGHHHHGVTSQNDDANKQAPAPKVKLGE